MVEVAGGVFAVTLFQPENIYQYYYRIEIRSDRKFYNSRTLNGCSKNNSSITQLNIALKLRYLSGLDNRFCCGRHAIVWQPAH